MEGVNYVREYVRLKDNNRELAEENARLRSEIQSAFYEEGSSRITVTDSARTQQYTYITARVINNTLNRRNNYLTLDKGSLQGVRPEMGVIAPNGVVGIVQHVSEHYCTVMSLLHSKTRVSAMIKRNGFFGSLVWDGESPSSGTLNEIDKTVPVMKGDTIVTTSFSAIFPSGIMLGVVSESKLNPGSNFHEINVHLSTPFRNLSNVYIVDNLLKGERNNLEAKNPPDQP